MSRRSICAASRAHRRPGLFETLFATFQVQTPSSHWVSLVVIASRSRLANEDVWTLICLSMKFVGCLQVPHRIDRTSRESLSRKWRQIPAWKLETPSAVRRRENGLYDACHWARSWFPEIRGWICRGCIDLRELLVGDKTSGENFDGKYCKLVWTCWPECSN